MKSLSMGVELDDTSPTQPRARRARTATASQRQQYTTTVFPFLEHRLHRRARGGSVQVQYNPDGPVPKVLEEGAGCRRRRRRGALGGVGAGADAGSSCRTRGRADRVHAVRRAVVAGARRFGLLLRRGGRGGRRASRSRVRGGVGAGGIGGPEPEATGPRLVVMASNLYLGQADARAVLRIAREHDVDVWSVQELRPGLMRQLDRRAPRTCSRSACWTRARARRAQACCRGRAEGGRHLAQPQGHAEPEVELRVAGAPPVRLKAVHPSPPVNATAAPFWQDALAALPGSDGRGDVQILAGDFNATLDHAELRGLLGRGYTDAADAIGKGSSGPGRRCAGGLADDDRPRARRQARQGREGRGGRVPGSDHRAVIATLRLPKA